MGILELPEEMVELCLAHADTATLKSLRLSAKHLLPSATKQLFKHLHILRVFGGEDGADAPPRVRQRITGPSAGRVQNILQDPGLNRLVNTVTLDLSGISFMYFNMADFSRPDTSETGSIWSESDEYPFDEDTDAILQDVSRFTNLQSVRLKFDDEVAGEWPDYPGSVMEPLPVSQRTEWREMILRSLITSLKHTAVSSLTIINLQDVCYQKIVESEDFKATMSRLDTLELQIATEIDDHGGDQGTLTDPWTFFGNHLKQYWLRPVTGCLTNLKLYGNQAYWGYIPFCDLRDVQFPRLQKLALGMYTFTHDWQLEWILSHGTLQSLILDNCPITYTCNMWDEYRADRMPPTYEEFHQADRFGSSEGPTSTSAWQYAARWSDYFRHIKQGLPNLRHFACGYGAWDRHLRGTAFEDADSLVAHLALQRYMHCDGGHVAWLEPERRYQYDEHGNIIGSKGLFQTNQCEEYPAYPDCDKEDQEALHELLQTIAKRG